MKKIILLAGLAFYLLNAFAQIQSTSLLPISVTRFKLPLPVTPPGLVLSPITIKNIGTQTATFVFLNPIPGQENIYNDEDSMKHYLLHAGHFDDIIGSNDDTIAVIVAAIESVKNPAHENSLFIAGEWNQVLGAGNAQSNLVDSVRMRKYGSIISSTLYHVQCGEQTEMTKERLMLTGLFKWDDFFYVSLGSALDSNGHSTGAVKCMGDTVFFDADVNEVGCIFRNPAKHSGYASPSDLQNDTSLITEEQFYLWPNPTAEDSVKLSYGGISDYRKRFKHMTVMPQSFTNRCFKTKGDIHLSSQATITFLPPQFPKDKYLIDMSDSTISSGWDSIKTWGYYYLTTPDTFTKTKFHESIKAKIASMIPYLTPDSALGVLTYRNFKKVDGKDLMPLEMYNHKVPTFTITIPSTNHDLILGQDVGVCNWVTYVKTSKPLQLWNNVITDSVNYLNNLWSHQKAPNTTKEGINIMNNGIIHKGTSAEFTVAFSPFIPNPSKGFKIGQGLIPDTLMINNVLMIDKLVK